MERPLRNLALLFGCVAALAAGSCTSRGGGPRGADSGTPDLDAFVESDTGPASDAGPESGTDGGSVDASARDGGPRDGGPLDTGPRDAGVHDAGPGDSGAHDAGPAAVDVGTDAGVRTDAGFTDAGARCVGGPRVGLYAADDMPAHVAVHDFLVPTGLLSSVVIGGPVVDGPTGPARIPTLAELMAYDAVFVWGSGAWDGNAFGNVLADYVDAGGGVVIAVFAQRSGSATGVSGRMETAGYLPYVPGSYQFAAVSLGTVAIPSHPIMAGVSTFRGTNIAYHDGAIASGATLVASWDNGRPMAATLEPSAGRTALLGMYPVRFWDTTSDGARLMANMLRWVARCP